MNGTTRTFGFEILPQNTGRAVRAAAKHPEGTNVAQFISGGFE